MNMETRHATEGVIIQMKSSNYLYAKLKVMRPSTEGVDKELCIIPVIRNSKTIKF
ncbi:hypothetical protein E2C01_066823 [Portunus trituberculatus]|uniref:Uncharacterized protein n=1 Tax=Portunus trituberculatus TaxID=210409 RepID=A0A5B7HMJ9_PORTR|nr:hypothetical protein [Portunus trituberculatus]